MDKMQKTKFQILNNKRTTTNFMKIIFKIIQSKKHSKPFPRTTETIHVEVEAL